MRLTSLVTVDTHQSFHGLDHPNECMMLILQAKLDSAKDILEPWKARLSKRENNSVSSLLAISMLKSAHSCGEENGQQRRFPAGGRQVLESYFPRNMLPHPFHSCTSSTT
uniref:Uncharacterized protein n=1 Tax=Sphaerodactylus townsendi TaxID=933632 RepID=A0ACB8EBZ7_9SAUR